MPHNVDVTEIIVQLIDFFPTLASPFFGVFLKIHLRLFWKRFHKEGPQHHYTTKVNDIICFFANGLLGSIKVCPLGRSQTSMRELFHHRPFIALYSHYCPLKWKGCITQERFKAPSSNKYTNSYNIVYVSLILLYWLSRPLIWVLFILEMNPRSSQIAFCDMWFHCFFTCFCELFVNS